MPAHLHKLERRVLLRQLAEDGVQVGARLAHHVAQKLTTHAPVAIAASASGSLGGTRTLEPHRLRDARGLQLPPP